MYLVPTPAGTYYLVLTTYYSLRTAHRCIWFLLQRVQTQRPSHKTWLTENDYTDEFGNTTVHFPESYAVSFSAALFMLVGSTDGAYTAPEKALAIL